MHFSSLTMTLLVVLRAARVAGFQAVVPKKVTIGFGTSRSSQLSASFFDDLSKTFSSMTSGSNNPNSNYYTVGITGAGGLIGTAFRDELTNVQTINGKPIRIVELKRGSQAEDKSILPADDATSSTVSTTSLVWNPYADKSQDVISSTALKEMDALIHLSGENISTGLSGPLAPIGIRPWTDEKKQEIIDSRVVTTTALSKAIADSNNKKLSFLVASGIGVYGPDFILENGNAPEPADESADISNSRGFLAEVSRQWEGAASVAQKSGNRVVALRNGVVLSTNGGALAKLYPIFLLGGGGIVGSGNQYFPYISARDMARAMVHVMTTPSLKGPVNVCAPGSCTNAEFTDAMGKVLGRPTLLPFPGFAVSLLFGEMGEEVLLGGTRAQPKKLLDSGFTFSHPTVEAAVQSAVDESI